MSDHTIIRTQFASRTQPRAEHNPKFSADERQPVFTRVAVAAGNRDTGAARSRLRRQGDDEVFYPQHSTGRHLATPGLQYGPGVPPVLNGQVPTIAPYVRERLLLGLPATAQYIAPYEFPATLDYEKGRVLVTPLQPLPRELPSGTVVSTAMNGLDSYF
ncbi:MAG: hypothetical protein JWQ41_461 [Variovorax sp.]|nr:hypothetical protein [Variovorax sp.]